MDPTTRTSLQREQWAVTLRASTAPPPATATAAVVAATAMADATAKSAREPLASPVKRSHTLAGPSTPPPSTAAQDADRRSALARLFAAATDSVPTTSPLHVAVASRLQIDPDARASRPQTVESPHRFADAPLSWPRAFGRKSIQTHPSAIAASAYHTPMPSPEPASSHVESQPQQRFFNAKALDRTDRPLQHTCHQSDAETEPQDEVSKLREQNALLRKNLEYEQMRRIVDQKRMQEKIVELQGLIRRDFPEQQKAQERRLVQMRSPNAMRAKSRSASKHGPRVGLTRRSSKSGDELAHALSRRSSKSSDELSRHSSKSSDERSLSRKSSRASDVGATSDSDDNNQTAHGLSDDAVKALALSPGPLTASLLSKAAAKDEGQTKWTEARVKKQLAKLRARMQVLVTDAHAETEILRTQLQSEKLAHERKERQLRVETNAKIYALQERHTATKKRLSANVALLTSQVRQLRTETEMLTEQIQEKDARIRHLELAVGGKRLVDSVSGQQQ